MKDLLVTSLRVTLVTLLLTGILYPLAVTRLAQLLMPWRASGSLVRDERGLVVGSELLGQAFASAAYFHARPSAAGAGYDATASGGSNLGPTSARLRDRVAAQAAVLVKENPDAPGPVPVELVATSGSGLDPHVTPEGALWQVARVSRARGIAAERIRAAVLDRVEGRSLGMLGEPRVNVLLLNLALDRQFGRPAGAPAAAAR